MISFAIFNFDVEIALRGNSLFFQVGGVRTCGCLHIFVESHAPSPTSAWGEMPSSGQSQK